MDIETVVYFVRKLGDYLGTIKFFLHSNFWKQGLWSSLFNRIVFLAVLEGFLILNYTWRGALKEDRMKIRSSCKKYIIERNKKGEWNEYEKETNNKEAKLIRQGSETTGLKKDKFRPEGRPATRQQENWIETNKKKSEKKVKENKWNRRKVYKTGGKQLNKSQTNSNLREGRRLGNNSSSSLSPSANGTITERTCDRNIYQAEEKEKANQ